MGVSPGKDTLVIHADGTYQQTIHLTDPDFDYESEWLPWHVEYSDKGLPYLHLDGMRPCAYGDGSMISCDQVGGGTGNNGYWYDGCEDTTIQMPNEVILIVMGDPDGFATSPRGIRLAMLQQGEDTWGYWLQEP
jgi:hypothetical protein